MTRYPSEHKARTREKIVQAAARAFRSKGYANAGIDAVMRAAGLTHGGFYAHFRSKAVLFAEAVRHAVLRSAQRLDQEVASPDPGEWLTQFVGAYLSAEHLACRADGCPLPSLLSEIDRAPVAVRRAFAEAGTERVAVVASRFEALGWHDPTGEAVALFAALSGAMAMARAMPDRAAAMEILTAVRDRQLARIRAGSNLPA